MEKIMKSIVRSSFISSGILIILGLLLFIRSDDTIIAISYIVGGTVIVLGLLAFIKYFRTIDKDITNSVEIVYGIITIVFGVFIISHPKLVATIIPVVIGTLVLIKSSLKIAYAIELRKANNEVWKTTLITSLISAIVGILMIFNPFKTSELVFKIIGVAIIIYATMDIISTIQLKKSISDLNKNDQPVNNTNKEIETESNIVEAEIEELTEEDKTETENTNQENNTKKKKNKRKKNKDSE